MEDRTDLQYIKSWGFSSRKAFEKSIQQTVEDLIFDAQRLFSRLQITVKEWGRDTLKNQSHRFVAETISPPNDKLVKSPVRIAQKIIESWKEHDEWAKEKKQDQGKEPEKHDPINFLETITDVIRFRIVCNYLIDVYNIDIRLKKYITASKDLFTISRKDYVETPFPDRRAGHRAIQYTIKNRIDKREVLFEVQIMTQLQHAWDKKDHHLIYEYVRIEKDKKIPIHLKNRVAAMSELLYVADVAFDYLREEIAKIMEKKKK